MIALSVFVPLLVSVPLVVLVILYLAFRVLVGARRPKTVATERWDRHA